MSFKGASYAGDMALSIIIVLYSSQLLCLDIGRILEVLRALNKDRSNEEDINRMNHISFLDRCP